MTTTGGEGKTQKEKNGQGLQVKGAAPPAMSIKSEGMLQDEGIDLPSLLENELNNGENGGEHFAQAAMASNGGNSEGMLMSEAIVSFRESAGGTPSLFLAQLHLGRTRSDWKCASHRASQWENSDGG